MKIVASSDWRDGLPFDKPVRVADVAEGEPARCFSCGADSAPQDRTELWAVKHRHPKNHSGYVRFYCDTHVPAPQPVAPTTPPRRAAARRPRSAPAERHPAPRRPSAVEEIVRAKCPDCFIEVSATGECGMCGQRVG
ncbi:glucose-6-phosphate dehydrogenase [Microbacterium aquimaris]|uniref:glucose-6-phosphate dehydrogenase n=1 Tax=Microbacterium aquimaris TaxID=459816 RepID=UPI002AD4C94F|nr:glucose-6-phosphate dehydrogenase [Microbacterium aquimaris]MDZ8277014.1 glucose-6-phosphate dehydrogenase [Microbacterium aquimaris]